MAFVSKAHREKCNELLAAGIITQDQYDQIARDTPREADLPERKPSDGVLVGPQPKKGPVNPFW